MSILDQIMQERILAKKRLASSRMLFPEEEINLTKLINSGRKKSRVHNSMAKSIKQRIRTKVSALVTNLIDKFDEDCPARKQIKALRKALQDLAHERFPKGGKKKKLISYKEEAPETEDNEDVDALEDEIDEVEEPKKKKKKKKKKVEVEEDDDDEEEDEDEEEEEEDEEEDEEDEDEEEDEEDEEEEEEPVKKKVKKKKRK